MKTLKKISLFILMAGMMSSCEDAYKIDQYGEYRYEIAIETLDDMNLALIELYDNVEPEDAIAFTSYFTDETAIGVENGGQALDEYRFNLFASNTYASAIWLDNYQVINYANRIIESSEKVILDPESETFDDDMDEKNRILAEARALRAYSHFQLLTYFSTDLKNDGALGVIILDHVPPVLPNVEQLPRSTNAEVFEFINADLDFAEDNLVAGNSAILVTPRFLTGLRARMAAYRGNYVDALTYAQSAIDQSPTANQGLAARTQYPSIFIPTGTSQSLTEIIFGLERPINKTAIAANWFFNEANIDGGPFMEVSRSLFDALRETNDIRTSVIVGPTSLISPNYQTIFDYKYQDVLILNKYPGTPAANLPLNNRVPVMRVSEMHLIKAEAQVAAGDYEAARTTLNYLRARRITGAGASIPAADLDTEQEGWRAILDERRLELAFEGHRYIDLKRLGTLAGVPGVQRYERDCEPYGACELPVTDHRFTLPIPLRELNGNRVIRSQQNPGY